MLKEISEALLRPGALKDRFCHQAVVSLAALTVGLHWGAVEAILPPLPPIYGVPAASNATNSTHALRDMRRHLRET